jgi:hypothetical protein
MLFWILVVIFIVYYVTNKNKAGSNKKGANPQAKGSTLYAEQNRPEQPSQSRTAERTYRTETRSVTAADRARLEAYRVQKAYKTQGSYTAPVSGKQGSRTSSAAASGKQGNRMSTVSAAGSGRNAAGYPVKQAGAQQKTDILSRAQQNVKKYEADETLLELEQDHDHTEQSARTISREEQAQKKAAHPHDAAHVSAAVSEESESLLGTIEDLMVKGYDGKLSFERDFVGEGMDMISRFTVPDTFTGKGAL